MPLLSLVNSEFMRSGILLAVLAAIAYSAGISALAAPFSATCALLALMPNAPFSSPRTLIVSHAICIGIGAGFAALPLPIFVIVVSAAWLSIMMMSALRALHAPAVAHTVILALGVQSVASYALWAMAIALCFALYAKILLAGQLKSI